MLEGSQQMLAVLLKFLLLHWQEPLTDSQMRGSFPFYFHNFPVFLSCHTKI